MCVRTVAEELEKCLPYPTLAQKSGDATSASSSQSACDPRGIKRMTGIPRMLKRRFRRRLRSRVFKPDADSAYRKIGERDRRSSVREHIRNRGYFKVTATAKLTVVYGAKEADVGVLWLSVPRPDRNTEWETSESSPQIAVIPLIISPEVLRGLITTTQSKITGLKSAHILWRRGAYVDLADQIAGH